jgi:hypothetical protein
MSSIQVNSVGKIVKWWKNLKRNFLELKMIKDYIKHSLTCNELQDLSNKCHSINNECKGDGSGLSAGALIDMFICRYFAKLDKYEEFHCGESDMKICNIELSQKKISGRSNIALDWSKNDSDKEKLHFEKHMIIINLKTARWWKSNPRKIINNDIIYNDIIKSGIYLIDKDFCKENVDLSCNNKSNTLIGNQYLYLMLKNSISQNLYIEIPERNKILNFNLLDAFSE